MPFFHDIFDNYKQFVDYCDEHGKKKSYIISSLINDFLIRKGVIKGK